MSYLFYDLETTGFSRAFDQVLTFAAIRTDEDLEPIDRRRIDIRLRPDVIPSPEAVCKYGIHLSSVRQAGRSELRAVHEIHGLLNEPGTISLGYDTLSFADEMLRFTFFRNLLPPYTHQWENNCGRMDLSPMVTVYWLQENSALRWPEREQNSGSPLSLRSLNAANQFVDEALTSAESRVEASLQLARALRKDRRLWEQLKDQFDRNIDRDYLERLPLFSIGSKGYRVGLMVSRRFGPENNYQRPVICLGSHHHYNNQTAWLVLDSARLRGAGVHSITQHADVIARKFGVPHFLFPPGSESVARLDDKRRTIARRNSQWLQDHPEVFHQIAGYYLEHTYPDTPNVDVDAALYPFGFLRDRQKKLCERFHAADTPEARVEQIDAFDSDVLRELATRVLMRNHPPAVWDDKIGRYARWYRRRIVPEHSADVLRDHRGARRRTPSSVRRQMVAIHRDNRLDSSREKLLAELERYLDAAFDVGTWPTQISHAS